MMLFKTKGLVLNFVKYRESSIIAKIFTQEYGLKSYIVNGVRSRSAKTNRIALYQPLTFLEMVVYNKPNAAINRIAEARMSLPLHAIATNYRKSAIAIFLAELLAKSLKEEEGNFPLFQFLEDSFLYLNQANSGFENFHLQFLLKLPGYLGFGISTYKDLLQEFPDLQAEEPAFWVTMEALLQQPYTTAIAVNLNNRRELLHLLLRFYPYHIEHFGEMKSLEILRQIQ